MQQIDISVLSAVPTKQLRNLNNQFNFSQCCPSSQFSRSHSSSCSSSPSRHRSTLSRSCQWTDQCSASVEHRLVSFRMPIVFWILWSALKNVNLILHSYVNFCAQNTNQPFKRPWQPCAKSATVNGSTRTTTSTKLQPNSTTMTTKRTT